MARKTALVVLVLGFLTPPVVAGDAELTPFAGYRLGGSVQSSRTGQSASFQDASSYGLIFDYAVADEARIEFLWSHQETGIRVPLVQSSDVWVDFDVDYFQIGGMYQPGVDRVRPYVVATLGASHFSPETGGLSSTTRFSFSVGGGAKVFLGDRIGLRFEGRGYGTFVQSGGGAFCSAGCSVYFSGNVLWQLEFSVGLIIAF